VKQFRVAGSPAIKIVRKSRKMQLEVVALAQLSRTDCQKITDGWCKEYTRTYEITFDPLSEAK
jgi:hypothetical protein